MMNKETHTRNQKRMYRIHKLEEKIHNQDLLIGTLQQRIDDAKDVVKEIKLHYQQPPTMIPSVKIHKLDEILGGKE